MTDTALERTGAHACTTAGSDCLVPAAGVDAEAFPRSTSERSAALMVAASLPAGLLQCRCRGALLGQGNAGGGGLLLHPTANPQHYSPALDSAITLCDLACMAHTATASSTMQRQATFKTEGVMKCSAMGVMTHMVLTMRSTKEQRPKVGLPVLAQGAAFAKP